MRSPVLLVNSNPGGNCRNFIRKPVDGERYRLTVNRLALACSQLGGDDEANPSFFKQERTVLSIPSAATTNAALYVLPSKQATCYSDLP